MCSACAYNSDLEYQWDLQKAELNLAKHGVDFADAIGAFEDEWALTRDEQFVDDEERFVTMGVDFLGRVLVVVYTY